MPKLLHQQQSIMSYLQRCWPGECFGFIAPTCFPPTKVCKILEFQKDLNNRSSSRDGPCEQCHEQQVVDLDTIDTHSNHSEDYFSNDSRSASNGSDSYASFTHSPLTITQQPAAIARYSLPSSATCTVSPPKFAPVEVDDDDDDDNNNDDDDDDDDGIYDDRANIFSEVDAWSEHDQSDSDSDTESENTRGARMHLTSPTSPEVVTAHYNHAVKVADRWDFTLADAAALIVNFEQAQVKQDHDHEWLAPESQVDTDCNPTNHDTLQVESPTPTPPSQSPAQANFPSDFSL